MRQFHTKVVCIYVFGNNYKCSVHGLLYTSFLTITLRCRTSVRNFGEECVNSEPQPTPSINIPMMDVPKMMASWSVMHKHEDRRYYTIAFSFKAFTTLVTHCCTLGYVRHLAETTNLIIYTVNLPLLSAF